MMDVGPFGRFGSKSAPLVALVGFLASLGGCGGELPPPAIAPAAAAASSARATEAMRGLTLLVTAFDVHDRRCAYVFDSDDNMVRGEQRCAPSDAAAQFASALADALAGSGFKVVRDPLQPYDLALLASTGFASRDRDVVDLEGHVTRPPPHEESYSYNVGLSETVGVTTGLRKTDSGGWYAKRSRAGSVLDQQVDASKNVVPDGCNTARDFGSGLYGVTFQSEGFQPARAAVAFARQLTTCDQLEAFAVALSAPPRSAAAVADAPPPPARPPATEASAAPTAPTVPPPPAAFTFLSAAPQPMSYALVVGVERYRDIPAAPGARTDSERFVELARRTLGLRDEHVRVINDDHATRTDLLEGLAWLKDNVPAGGRVYFFFSGHGAPRADSSTFLLPYDGNPKNVTASGVAMADLMKKLAETKAHDVLAFVDSCFSGAGGRSVLPPGARPLMLVKAPSPGANMALFAAAQEDEISGNAPGENAGVFSKYLVQALGTGAADGDGDGQISMRELDEWVSPRVAREAKKDSRDQHPRLILGSRVGAAKDLIVEYGVATSK